jgi:uncharacterized LabA/DUF88 family protein
MVREIRITEADRLDEATAATPERAKRPPKKKKVAVFIDGSNLYFKLRTLVPTKMDFIRYRYRELAESFLQSNERLSYIGYYVGVVRDTKRTSNHEKTLELVKNQQKVFEQLRHQQIDIVKGYLLERDGKYFEKGVDVRLAVDIVTMAQAKQYDVAVVISSDTDLIPAMQAAQKHKRQVAYIGFEHQPSLALIRYADRSKLVSRREAEKFSAPPLAIRRFDDDPESESQPAKE